LPTALAASARRSALKTQPTLPNRIVTTVMVSSVRVDVSCCSVSMLFEM